MIMQNSYLKLSTFPNTTGLTIVQGDKTPLKFQLLDKSQNVFSNLDDIEAEIRIFESSSGALREYITATVNKGEVTFSMSSVLNVGEHSVRIKVGEYYFPSSTSTFQLNVIEAHDISDVDPADIQTIDLVIDALSESMPEKLEPVVTEEVETYFNNNPDRFKGEKGDTTLVPPQTYTRDEYEALSSYDPNVLYIITDEEV